MSLRGNRLFIESAARDFKRTGAIIPSSKVLAMAMVREICARRNGFASVLEAGGGTGSITAEIIKNLRSGDRLDVYEIDASFVRLIRQRVNEDRAFRSSGAQIRVYNRPVQEITRAPKYDFILSCLPFANFTPEAVCEIFEIFRSVLNPGGICSFYQYLFVKEAIKIVSGKPEERERVEGVGKIVRSYLQAYEFDHEIVLRNLPPAVIHHIRFCDRS